MGEKWNPEFIVIGVPARFEEHNADAGKALQSALKAAIPGFQGKKNMADTLQKARQAYYRTMLRLRRARERKTPVPNSPPVDDSSVLASSPPEFPPVLSSR